MMKYIIIMAMVVAVMCNAVVFAGDKDEKKKNDKKNGYMDMLNR
jgi:hypothetical protein